MDLLRKMINFSEMETDVDIVFVVDATNTMCPTWEMLKASVMFLGEHIKERVEASYMGKIGNLRIKIVWFKDFLYCGDAAYGESVFFGIPSEKERLKDYIVNVNLSSSGPKEGSALEALTMAMRSDFTQGGTFRRHIIILFTDAPARPFEEYEKLRSQAVKHGCKPALYPDNMPRNLREFMDIWNGGADPEGKNLFGLEESPTKLDMTGRRLILLAPNTYPWTEMEYEMNNLVRMDVDLGRGCRNGFCEKVNIEDLISIIEFSC